MKHHISRFKSLKDALEELKPFIKNPKLLKTGRPLLQLGNMRPREALANWLICVAMNDTDNDYDLEFTSTPRSIEGDGIIRDKLTDNSWVTEHVFVLGLENKCAETQILKKNRTKNQKRGRSLCLWQNTRHFSGRSWFVVSKQNLQNATKPDTFHTSLGYRLAIFQKWCICLFCNSPRCQ